jgi:ATP-dependent Lon protease
LPVLPLRDVVVYPHMVIPLFVGRDKSIQALEQAMEADKQHPAGRPEGAAEGRPAAEDIYAIGTVAEHPAAAQAARRHRQGAGRGRSRVPIVGDHRPTTFFAAEATCWSTWTPPTARDRGAGPLVLSASSSST